MNRHHVAHGHSAFRRGQDDHHLDTENKYNAWVGNAEDIIDDEKEYFDRKWRSPSHHKARRNRILKQLACIAGVCMMTLWWFLPRNPVSPTKMIRVPAQSLDPDFEEIETVRYYDLEDMQGTSQGWDREERVLLCTPLRDAAQHLPMFFSHLRNLTYPHNLIDLAFLVSDSKDDTENALNEQLKKLQNDSDPKMPYGEISIIHKDFGQAVGQDVDNRHGFAAQAPRRKLMARARNWLLSAAFRPYHSWVYWRDADVETCPFTIIEDLMRHDRDVIVPNVWRPLPDWLGGEQPYDLNSWQDTETALALAESLDEDAVIVEGYAEYATWRPHLAYLRDPYGDPDVEMELDGIGGVSILAKAKVFRAGVHFPAFSFERHAETEGFGKMARRMKFSVVGLPHYTIWHLYEPSLDDLKHMQEMDQQKKQKQKEEAEKQERLKKVKEEFKDISDQWSKDKQALADSENKAIREKMEKAKSKDHDVASKKAKIEKD